ELVADEISPLPEDSPSSASDSTGNGAAATSSANGHAPAPAPASAGTAAGSAPAPPPAATASRRTPAGAGARAVSRTLILVFTTTIEGLTFQANWVNPDKKRVPALGQPAQTAGQGHATVSSSERAKLIGLAAYARKAHFAYNQETGLYVLGSVTEI